MVGDKRQGGVRAASDSSIEIDFYYRGVRCRERLKLPPTPRNLKFAENLLGQVKVEIEKGIFDYAAHFPKSPRARVHSSRPGGLITVSKALDDWYDRRVAELQHSTLIGYRRIIDNVWSPACGSTLLRDLSRSQIKTVIADLGPEVTAKRVNNVLGPMRGMLAEAFDDQIIDRNPSEKLVIRRKGKTDTEDKIDPFTPAEIAAILGTATGQFRNYCQFNFATGLRTSEMIGLCWPRIDWVGKRARITQAFVMGEMKTTKTKAGLRDIDLLPMAIAALNAQKEHSLLKGETIFLNPCDGKPWKGDRTVRDPHWKDVLKRAGVRYRYPYQMRHTFASQALSAGENVMWVARQLGHKDWTVTARKYARWIPSVVPDAGAKVQGLWSRFGQQTG